MLYTLPKFAEEIGYSKRTLFKLIKAGLVTPAFRRNGRNYFTDEQVREAKRLAGIEEEEGTNRKVIAYSRVSSSNQKLDLATQTQLLERFSVSNGFVFDEYIEDIGSGINFTRKGFLKILTMVFERQISHVVITYPDRLARFAYELLKEIFNYFGCEIIAINLKTTSPQEELVEDLMTIVHVFSSRLYGLRKNKKRIKELAGDTNHQDTSS